MKTTKEILHERLQEIAKLDKKMGLDNRKSDSTIVTVQQLKEVLQHGYSNAKTN